MGESHENLLKAVRHYQESLDKYTENRNDGKLLHYLERLYKLPIKVVHLEQTGVGRTVNGLRKLGGEVGDSAKTLVAKWKDMVVGEQEEEDDEEDGYQTGDDPLSDDKDDREEHSSSHRKSDNHRTEDREKKSKHSSKSEKKDKHKHKHNGHSSSSKHKSSHKRKIEDSSSEEETVKKKPRRDSSDDEDNHRKKHKHEEEKKKKSSTSSSSSSSERHKESSRDKDKHKSSKRDEGKKHDHKKEKKSDGSKSKDHKSKDKSEKTAKKSITATTNGIDSGSGASFAEALGMCEPEPSSSTSTSARKKKSSSGDVKKEKVSKVEDSVPKLLKEPALEPIDINLSSLLPTITPNYRPLGNLMGLESQPKKSLSDYEALSNIITSKNQRTKVYSGNKMGTGKVSSLFELCIRVLQDNVDALEYTGGVPYSVLKPILEKSNPNQLYALEHHNPYLIEDTDELWQLHCQKEFRNKKREEFESWREMYMRCLDERDAKLKALTANIKQAQDKSLPVRTTKLAYVETVAKPPRNIARKQAKHGTGSGAIFDKKPAVTPAARLSALATAGDAGKVAVPNPGSRAAERAGHAVKPKKAPLMLKSISSFKNRFKR